MRTDETLFTIADFLSAAECAALIRTAESVGFEHATITTARGFVSAPEVRNNTRVMLDTLPLARDLWSRLAPHLAPRRAEALGLNERLRFYRYEPGQRFGWHRDGSFCRDDEASELTFMVYLNDGFEGGSTDFELERDGRPIVVEPRAGMALVFAHHLRHQGAAVVSGTKYVVRSDVMFRRVRSAYQVIEGSSLRSRG